MSKTWKCPNCKCIFKVCEPSYCYGCGLILRQIEVYTEQYGWSINSATLNLLRGKL